MRGKQKEIGTKKKYKANIKYQRRGSEIFVTFNIKIVAQVSVHYMYFSVHGLLAVGQFAVKIMLVSVRLG